MSSGSDVVDETKEESVPRVNTSVQDAQCTNISVKSLVRKLSDITSQRWNSRCPDEPTHFVSHGNMISDASERLVPNTAGHHRSDDAALLERGALRATQDSRGVDAVLVVKGGVASLINKFQCRSSSYESSKLGLQKSCRGQDREQQPVASVGCVSTDSGINSSTMENDCSSIGDMQLSFKNHSRTTPKKKLIVSRDRSSPTALIELQKPVLTTIHYEASVSKRMGLTETVSVPQQDLCCKEEQLCRAMSSGVSSIVSTCGDISDLRHLSTDRLLFEPFLSNKKSEIDKCLNITPHYNGQQSPIIASEQVGYSNECTILKNSNSKLSKVNKSKDPLMGTSVVENKHIVKTSRVIAANSHSSIFLENVQFGERNIQSLEQDVFFSNGTGLIQQVSQCTKSAAARISMQGSYYSDSVLDSEQSLLRQAERNTTFMGERKQSCESRKLELDLCNNKRVHNNHVTRLIKAGYREEYVKDTSSSSTASSMRQCPLARMGSTEFVGTEDGPSGLARLYSEADWNNHGQEISRIGNLWASGKDMQSDAKDVNIPRGNPKMPMYHRRPRYNTPIPKEFKRAATKAELTKDSDDFNCSDDSDFIISKTAFLAANTVASHSMPYSSELGRPLTIKVPITPSREIENRSSKYACSSQFPASRKVKAKSIKKPDIYKVHFCGEAQIKNSPSRQTLNKTVASAKTEKMAKLSKNVISKTGRYVQPRDNTVLLSSRRETPKPSTRRTTHECSLQEDPHTEAKSGQKCSECSSNRNSPVPMRHKCAFNSPRPPWTGTFGGLVEKQGTKIEPKRNLKSFKCNSPRPESLEKPFYGSFARAKPASEATCKISTRLEAPPSRGLLDGFRSDTLHTADSIDLDNFRELDYLKTDTVSLPFREGQGIAKFVQGTSREPLSTVDISPRLNRKCKRYLEQDTSLLSSRIQAISATATDVSKPYVTLTRTGSSVPAVYRNHEPLPVGTNELRPRTNTTICPAAVKSDPSVTGASIIQTTLIKRNEQDANKSPSLEIPREASFTKIFRSESPSGSPKKIGFNGSSRWNKTAPHALPDYLVALNNGKCDKARPSKGPETKRVGAGDGIRRTKLAMVSANCSRRNSSGRTENLLDNLEKYQETTTFDTRSRKFSKLKASSRKEILPPELICNAKALPRSDRVDRVIAGGQETMRTFHKYSNRVFSGPNEVAQTVTEEARQIKECCIVVESMEEAETVADTLMKSACRDFSSLQWDQNKEFQDIESNYERAGSSDSELVIRKLDDNTDALMTFTRSNPMEKACRYKVDPNGNLCIGDCCSILTDKFRYHTRPSSKWKHLRKPLASVGETNLVDLPDIENIDQVCETAGVIPNVRKISIQPMICIPWHESEDSIQGRRACSRQMPPIKPSISVPELTLPVSISDGTRDDTIKTPLDALEDLTCFTDGDVVHGIDNGEALLYDDQGTIVEASNDLNPGKTINLQAINIQPEMKPTINTTNPLAERVDSHILTRGFLELNSHFNDTRSDEMLNTVSPSAPQIADQSNGTNKCHINNSADSVINTISCALLADARGISAFTECNRLQSDSVENSIISERDTRNSLLENAGNVSYDMLECESNGQGNQEWSIDSNKFNDECDPSDTVSNLSMQCRTKKFMENVNCTKEYMDTIHFHVSNYLGTDPENDQAFVLDANGCLFEDIPLFIVPNSSSIPDTCVSPGKHMAKPQDVTPLIQQTKSHDTGGEIIMQHLQEGALETNRDDFRQRHFDEDDNCEESEQIDNLQSCPIRNIASSDESETIVISDEQQLCMMPCDSKPYGSLRSEGYLRSGLEESKGSLVRQKMEGYRQHSDIVTRKEEQLVNKVCLESSPNQDIRENDGSSSCTRRDYIQKIDTILNSDSNEPQKHGGKAVNHGGVAESFDFPYCFDSDLDFSSRHKVSLLAAKFSGISSTEYQQFPNLRWTRTYEEEPREELRSETISSSSDDPPKEEYPILLLKLKEQHGRDEKREDYFQEGSLQSSDGMSEANSRIKGGIAKKMNDYLSSVWSCNPQQALKCKAMLDNNFQQTPKCKAEPIRDYNSKQTHKHKAESDYNSQQAAKGEGSERNYSSEQVPTTISMKGSYNHSEVVQNRQMFDTNITDQASVALLENKAARKMQHTLCTNSRAINLQEGSPQMASQVQTQYNDCDDVSGSAFPKTRDQLLDDTLCTNPNTTLPLKTTAKNELKIKDNISRISPTSATAFENNQYSGDASFGCTTKLEAEKISRGYQTCFAKTELARSSQEDESTCSSTETIRDSTSDGRSSFSFFPAKSVVSKDHQIQCNKSMQESTSDSDTFTQDVGEDSKSTLFFKSNIDKLAQKQSNKMISNHDKRSKNIHEKYEANKPSENAQPQADAASMQNEHLASNESSINYRRNNSKMHSDDSYVSSVHKVDKQSHTETITDTLHHPDIKNRDKSQQALYIDYLCSTMEESADSFNYLFIENVRYLKDVSTDSQSKPLRHDGPQGLMKRKSSFSKLSSGASNSSSRDKKPGDKKDRDQTSRGSDSASSPRRAAPTAQQVTNQPFRSCSTSPNRFSPSPSSDGKDHLLKGFATSPDISDNKCLSFLGSESLYLSNISDARASTLSDISKQLSYQASNQNVNPGDQNPKKIVNVIYDQPSTNVCVDEDDSRFSSYLAEAACSKNYTEKNESTGQEGEVAMDARLRRRLLQKSSDVSALESSNWRSRVYQSDNTNASNSSRPCEETRNSFRTNDRLGSLDIPTNDSEITRESRRRRSEDSNCGDLAERLARRRAKRREEQQDSVSQDGSCDSSHDRDPRWSNERSVRSLDSSEVDDSSGRAKHHESGVSGSDAWRNSRKNSRESIISTESIDHSEDLEEMSQRFWHLRRDSDGLNGGEPDSLPTDFRERKWSSKDSNFISADSSCSFKSYDDESLNNTQRPNQPSRADESNKREHAGSGGGRMRKIFQDNSDDSALSRSREKSEDASNSNNNNDSSLMPTITCFSGALRKHRMENFIDESEEIDQQSTEVLGAACNGGPEVSTRTCKTSLVNGSEYIQYLPQCKGYVQSTASVLVDKTKEDATTRDVTRNTSNSHGACDTPKISGEDGDLAAVLFVDHRIQAMPQDTREIVSGDLQANEQISDDITHTKATSEPAEASHSVDTREMEAPIPATNTTRDPSHPKRRKPRKDKSALRKSALNKADDSAVADVHDEENSNLGQEPGHSEERLRKGTEGSFVSQHAIFWEKHAPNIQNSTSSRQRMNIPNRYTGDKEKLTATRQKFMQNADASSETTSSSSASRLRPDKSEDVPPKPIVRGRTDFNQLLQKFSGSESNSEKSDTDIGGSSGIPRRRSLVKRQEAKDVISSSEESDARRTPDRTQSLKLPPRLGEGVRTGISENKGVSSTTMPEAPTSVEKSYSFRSEFMNQKWARRSNANPQIQKELLQTTTSSFTSGKTPLESKVDISTTLASSRTQQHGTSIKGSGLPSRDQDVRSHTETPLLSQNKSQDFKSPFRRAFTHSEGDTIKVAESSIPTAVKAPLDIATSLNASSGIAIKHETSFTDKSVNKITSIAEKSMDKTTSLAEKSMDKTTSLDEKSMNKTTSLGEKSMDKTTSLGEKSMDKTTSLDEKSMNKTTSLGEKSMDKTTSRRNRTGAVVKHNEAVVSDKSLVKPTDISDKSVVKTTSLSDKSVSMSSGTAVKHHATVISEKSVDKTLSLSEKSVDKTLGLNEKSVDKTLSLNEKSVDKTLSLSEKSVDKTLSLSEKSVDKTLSLSEKSVDKTSNLHVKSVDKTSSFSEKSVDKTLSLGEKSMDKTLSLSEKSKDKTPSLSEKSIDKTPSLSEKSIDKTPSLCEKSMIKTMSPRENYEKKATSLTDKSVSMSSGTEVNLNEPVIGEKSVDKTTTLGEKAVAKITILSKKSEIKTTNLYEKSENKTTNLDGKSENKTTNLDEKSENKTTNLDEKSENKTTNLDEKSENKTTNLDEKSENKTTNLDEKSENKTTNLDEKSENKTTNLDEKSENKTTNLGEKSENKTMSLSEKSINTNLSTAVKHNETVIGNKSVNKTTCLITSSDIGTKPNETVTNERSVTNDSANTISSVPKHQELELTDSNKSDTSTRRDYPQAKPRSSLQRDTKQERNLPLISTPSDFVPKISTEAVSSTLLSSSVSSSDIKSLTASTEASNVSEVRRASSFKEASVTRTDSIERRKGILKRNTSLTKHDVGESEDKARFPIIDPQLAKILRQRKQIVGDASDKEETEKKGEMSDRMRRPKALTAAEEIEQTLRYSQQKAAQRGLNPDEDEGLKRLSVAERIYSMQTKIEEEKFPVVTPKSRSGLSTPRSRQRSGIITPTIQKSSDDILQQSSMSSSVTAAVDTPVASNSSNITPSTKPQQQHPGSENTAVSSSQLMEKLSKIAKDTEMYEQRRHRFQHRARNDWRHQTQPVTYDEIQAADSLETVSAFRALVRKQASINAFDQLKVQTSMATKQPLPNAGKITEFPQHLVPPPKLPRRSRKLRHRTLPVTADELNAVPEHQMLVTDPDWIKLEEFDKRDSKADSGILSGSEADSLYHSESLRSLSLEMDLSENDPSRLSVTDKASIFRVLEEKTKAERDKEKSASGAKRYINRKKRERSQTMPITDEEVKSASEIGGGGSSCAISDTNRAVTISRHEPEVVNRSRSNSVTEEENKETADDDLVKLSLTEKVRLFSQPREAEKQPTKTEVTVVRRRSKKVASRFNTQPVTNEEVEKAAAFTRISPLAMSLVKPPDPEILKVLPLKDQRELMAQHAEMFLSQTSLRSRSGSNASQSQPSSRRTSITLEEGEVKTREDEEESDKYDKKGILKDKSASAKDLHDVKSILKTDPVKAKSESEVHSILKMDVKNILDTTFASSEPRGILKKTRSEDIGGIEFGEDIKGILKHNDNEEEENQMKPRSRSNSQPLGILKIENACQPNDHPLEIRSILKAPSQESVHDPPVMKSAMRRGSIESDTTVPSAAVLKSALRTRNKNSLENEDSHIEETVASDGTSADHDSDLNSNNSHKHISLTVSSSTDRADHLTSTTNSRHVFTTVTTSKSSVSADVQTYSCSSSMMTTSVSTNLDSLQVPEGSDEKGGQSASDDGESSSGEILDGTPRTSRLKRKSRFSDKAAKSERYKTQPPELTDTTSATTTPGDSASRRKYKYEGRHRTQPITPNEMREAEAITPAADLTRTPGGSIADRLNQLKSSGEEEWKKRVGRKEEVLASPDIIKLREKTGALENRPCSIADRLNELETSMTTWKDRVEESDAKQFTVAGRLTHGPTESPLFSKLKNLPRKDEPSSKNSSPLSSPVTPTKEFIAKIPLPKDIVQDTSVIVESVKTAAFGFGLEDEAEEMREPVKVEVPNMGEEIENFFAVKPIGEITDKVEMEVDDFNNIFIEAEMILSTVRKVRPARRTKPSSQNPLKTMSQKIEIRQEYTEVMYGTAEKEMKRVKKEALAKDAGFAQAALAGLASKENFKQVELRRTDSGSSVHGQGALDPFKEIMLLHVKGRRSVQTRLVEPHARSINEGDCYVLVTGDKVIHWEGRYANVIEKAKASEVASYIQQKKDLGCKKANEVFTVFQDKDHLGAGKPFWATLEGEKQFQACGPDAEDELYESSVVKCNMVYKLVGNALQPYEEYWGAIPKHEMLKKNEVIIFDFGTEFYLWQGKAVSMEQRKLGLKLSKQLYEKGYDYTESPINPLSPLRIEESGGLPLSSPTRPNWAIFGKVNQNMETILFREKFADWPDSSRLIGCKGHGPSETVSKELLEMKPFDAKRMIPCNTTPVNLKLEGANLGRGVKWSEDMQGFVKEQDIITLDVIAWHVLEYAHYKLPKLSHGQFHDGDTYVVRWQYMVANANLRSLKGSAARNSLTGRERCAYFFWQGNQSTINEKGASALMTVELDEERGPQVRVLQGKEPPCFLNLFGGRMILHIGKREDPTTNSQGAWRLYCLRGDYENEMYLLEISVCVQHLRSRSSMVLLNVKTGIVYVWHGAKSPKHVRELCLTAVSRLKETTPLEVGLHEKATITLVEVEEGAEKREFWTALDRPDRTIYHSLLTDPRTYNHTLRLFHMSSVNLVFEVHEQLNPAHAPDLVTPFPFLQSDLYRSTQPALFLIDNDSEVYLWQGWWPVGSHDTENVHTGSAIARFNLDRRLAMETTLHYCREKHPTKPPTAYLVCAGVEPICFTTLFPYWEDDIIVKDIASEEGKTLGYMEPVSDILHRLTKTRYTLAELQERPLPEGVDPLKLETYLFDADFEEILEMNRDEFYAQPHWKQIDLKKHVGLF